MTEASPTPGVHDARPEFSVAERRAASDLSAPERESLKHTINAIILAFVLAFVFRGFVAEPFVIPTGSMAPSLLGAHENFRSDQSGAAWTISPRDYSPSGSNPPLATQGAKDSPDGPLKAEDPMSGLIVMREGAPLCPGDRILVQKYIYAISEPRRWDVVVFKSPESPSENFIKRLVGLPGEEVKIVDGDIFTRRPDAADDGARRWRIQRKPERAQRALWSPIFSSEFAPVALIAAGHAWQGPWRGDGWRLDGLTYRTDAATPQPLFWEEGIDDLTGAAIWPIDDWVTYNDTPRMRRDLRRFPVSDVRVRAGVQAEGPGLGYAATIATRGHEFQGVIAADGTATLRMRPMRDMATAPSGSIPEVRGDEASWQALNVGKAGPLAPGRVVDVELWHADQALSLWVDGVRVAFAEYDWDPEERLRLAGGRSETEGARFDTASPESFVAPRITITVDGGPVQLHRLGLDRDLAHQPSRTKATFRLGEDQFFVLGDNSAASRDARAWDRVDPWVAAEIDDAAGVVPRELMMGKAFFVYFPAPHRSLRRAPVPDFGRMRFIR